LRRFSSVALLASALGMSCARDISCGVGREPRAVEIHFDAAGNRPDQATIRLVGIASRLADAGRNLSQDQWASALRVTVANGEDLLAEPSPSLPAVLGSYEVVRSTVVFKPQFGFDPGRQYRVVFDASKLPGTVDGWKPEPLVALVGLPKLDLAPSTTVTQVYPSAPIVAENQLRLYIHFSAPMGRQGGIGFVRLVDEAGDEVREPFLPLDAEFWNRDRTRFTVFFDPGRQKRGILPNEEMGRSLIEGRSYTLIVSRDWPDGNGLPLREEFRRRFTVGPPDEKPLDEKTWRIDPPRAGSRDALAITFPEPLDHGLLARALSVIDGSRQRVDGEARIDGNETRWLFTPARAWKRGDYAVQALTILEDMAGNRIGRAFEVDEFSRVDEDADVETVTISFRIE
jgi:hypothetical protein